MYILLFTHKDDIDGAGCEVLMKKAFGKDNVEAVPCSYNNLDNVLKSHMDMLAFDKYDLVFVTDMCPSEQMIQRMDRYEEKKRVQIIDHHQTSCQYNGVYDVVFSEVENARGKLTCATELLYKYLIYKGYIEATPALDKFVAETRLSDTWEWTIFHDIKADDMAELFNVIGYKRYVKAMLDKVNSSDDEFEFNDEEVETIKKRRQILNHEYLKAYNARHDVVYNGIKVVVVNIPYEFRNGFSQFLRDLNYPADIMILPDFKGKKLSFRTLSGASACDLAKEFYGGGSPAAAGSPISTKAIEAFELDALNSDNEKK